MQSVDAILEQEYEFLSHLWSSCGQRPCWHRNALAGTGVGYGWVRISKCLIWIDCDLHYVSQLHISTIASHLQHL